jgi:predicted metalloprotease with PDZ domain
MRLLWAKYGDESGVPETGIEAAAEEVAGTSLKPFFDVCLRSTAELDYSPFAHVGLEVRFRPRESAQDKGGTPARKTEKTGGAWLGVLPKSGAGIATVFEGSPAMEAGLLAEDEVVAVDGVKCDAPQLISRSDDKKPGDVMRVTVFRRDRLFEVPVTLGAKPSDGAYVVKLETVTEAQKDSYKAWLGASWDESEPKP